jgi:hypothetical protein
MRLAPDVHEQPLNQPFLPGGSVVPLSATMVDLLSQVDSLMYSIRDRSIMLSWYAGVVGELLKSRT